MFDQEKLKALREQKEQWEKTALKKTLDYSPER